MNLWGWIIAYVVGFSLLQVLIYRYLRGRGDTGAGGSSSERSFERTAPPRERRGADGGSVVAEQSLAADPLYTAGEPSARAPSASGRQCPRCGTLNELDPTFTYCRECVRPLS